MAVYFIQRGEAGPIKIGHTTTDVRKRRDNLQNANAEWLYIRGLMDGDRAVERALHARFKASRLFGEWFSPVPDLVELAAQHFTSDLCVEPRIRSSEHAAPTHIEHFVCDQDLALRVIDAFGGCAKAAQAISTDRCRVSISTVHGWGRNNGIPYWRFTYVLDGAAKAHVVLPRDFVTGTRYLSDLCWPETVTWHREAA